MRGELKRKLEKLRAKEDELTKWLHDNISHPQFEQVARKRCVVQTTIHLTNLQRRNLQSGRPALGSVEYTHVLPTNNNSGRNHYYK